MEETYLKLIYENLYTVFTDRENPLWYTFFDDEVEGFNKFKEHVYDDFSINLNIDTLTEYNFHARSIYHAGLILGKIERLAFFRSMGSTGVQLHMDYTTFKNPSRGFLCSTSCPH